MAFLDDYHQQVALLVRVLPFIAADKDFALKGGTAINLFVRNLPRLSVDIDLTFLPVADRPTSLAAIDAGMGRLADAITRGIPGSHVAPTRKPPDNIITKLVVRAGETQIKIEVTPVLRGVVYAPQETDVAPAVEDAYGFASIQLVSFADLYAGKIVAALDRQHPRDLFDVRDLLANEGITEELREAFIAYLVSHDRPIAEVLAPTLKPLEEEFAHGFEGMTREAVPLEDLVAARDAIIGEIIGGMPEHHRHFLMGFKRGAPDWSLLTVPTVCDLPAVRWKQINLDKLSTEKREAAAAKLERVLFPG
jgi:predicted nucleotidyltransferase component of viral defense system